MFKPAMISAWRQWRTGCVLLGAIVTCGIDLQAATTGWNRTTGSFVYSDTANWVGGTVNNLFDSSLTLTGPLLLEIPQTYATTGNLVFNYAQGQAGNEITLNGAGGTPSVLTLGGNVQFTPQLAAIGSLPTLTFGGNLIVDMGGGTRTFSSTLGTRVNVASGATLRNGTLMANTASFVLDGATDLSSLQIQGGVFTSNGTIGGTGQVSVSASTANLLRANTYQGGTTLAMATVNFSDKASFGSGPMTITDRTSLNATAGASLTGANAISNPITLAYPGNRYLAFTSQAPVEFSGPVDLGAASSRLINVYQPSGGSTFKTSFTGVMQGTGSSVVWGGNAPVFLSGASTYTGTTTIAGSVELGANALPNVAGPFGNAATDVALDISYPLASGDTVAGVAVLSLRPGVTMGRSMTITGGTITSSGGENFVTGKLTLNQYLNINVGAGGLMHFSGAAAEAGGFPGQYPVTFSGPGTALLEAGGLFTVAPIIINGGTVLFNAVQLPSGGKPITINAGALAGNATLAGPLTVGNTFGTGDATLSPGDGIGTMQAAAVTFGSDGVYKFELNSTAGTFDLLSVSGAVQLGDAVLVVDDLGTKNFPIGFQFTILKNTSANPTSGTFLDLPEGGVLQAGPNSYTIDYAATLDGDGQANDVILKVVPEPTSAACLIVGALALGMGRRKSRLDRALSSTCPAAGRHSTAGLGVPGSQCWSAD